MVSNQIFLFLPHRDNEKCFIWETCSVAFPSVWLWQHSISACLLSFWRESMKTFCWLFPVQPAALILCMYVTATRGLIDVGGDWILLLTHVFNYMCWLFDIVFLMKERFEKGRNQNYNKIQSVQCSQADTEITFYLAVCWSGLTMSCFSLMTKLGISEFLLYKQMIAFPQKHMYIFRYF